MAKKVSFGYCTPCPKCQLSAVRVSESRPSINGTTRRRKICNACGYRFTTREITEDQYQRFNELIRIVARVRMALTPGDDSVGGHTCDDCKHWDAKAGCGMGFPEAGGEFAEECSTFVLQ